MATNNRKGPIVDPGLCRCCNTLKKCRLLNVEYEWIGQKEVYSDMFMDTFGLLLSNLDGEAAQRLICATCVSRLRDASSFRRQVLCCEEALLQAQLAPDGVVPEIKQETEDFDPRMKHEQNIAPLSQADDCIDNDDDDVDHNDARCDVEEDPKTSMESEDEPPLKPKPTKTKVKKIKKGPKIKEKNTKKLARKSARLKNKPTVLEVIDELDAEDMQLLDIPPKPRPKPSEVDQRGLHNVITIVENSYVCPFDNSFSDYICVYCRQTFSDANTLRTHTDTHDPHTYKQTHNNKKLTQIDVAKVDCRLCSDTILDVDILKAHLVNSHGKLIYPTKNEFLKFKLTNKELRCTECESSFGFFHALKKHMAEHFGTCICDVCGAHYFEERMLILHQKTHQKTDENYPCPDCGKSFKSKYSRNLHEARTHKKEPAYQCPKCDEVFFSYSLRYRHMIDVHGDKRMYQCSHCDRAYDSRKSLREHNRRYHLKIFKHQCDLCDKRFYIPSRLKEHLATHSGERNFRCELCGKSYPRLRGLKSHLQSHYSENKYRCTLCGASFTQNSNLNNHMKRRHQQEEIVRDSDAINSNI
ncbi:hypothetical protein O0L34_g6629 [Tuta absoluta]|nr:hypothetical protein O0L34_g6629 [Tuta absoluta]